MTIKLKNSRCLVIYLGQLYKAVGFSSVNQVPLEHRAEATGVRGSRRSRMSQAKWQGSLTQSKGSETLKIKNKNKKLKKPLKGLLPYVSRKP